ncbi:DUF6677 family protein [Paenibacillus assamensis]|uniref:DUF6677 family protein n=1 Tax=Paenibacillus assamensis TaxID=311244 RepID=UPI0003FC1910|nr:DUF6677 family protein [Paenibacillus assamensis]
MSKQKRFKEENEEERFLRERMYEMDLAYRSRQGKEEWSGFPDTPYRHVQEPPFAAQKPPKKSKFVAILLACLFPGAGHFYLGLMQRGLLMIMLLVLDIVAVVYFSTSNMGTNVPLIVLLSLLMPVIYFFNLFDAMQHTDKVNLNALYGTPVPMSPGPWVGVLLMGIGVMLVLFALDPTWLSWVFQYVGSFLGAAALIGFGLYILLKETRSRR